MVLMEELPKIQAAAKAVYRGPMPNITMSWTSGTLERSLGLQVEVPVHRAGYSAVNNTSVAKANPDRKPVDVLQEVTHNICYMMGRATRSISYSGAWACR
jgi:eukaryotic translation initiation factor 2C